MEKKVTRLPMSSKEDKPISAFETLKAKLQQKKDQIKVKVENKKHQAEERKEIEKQQGEFLGSLAMELKKRNGNSRLSFGDVKYLVGSFEKMLGDKVVADLDSPANRMNKPTRAEIMAQLKQWEDSKTAVDQHKKAEIAEIDSSLHEISQMLQVPLNQLRADPEYSEFFTVKDQLRQELGQSVPLASGLEQNLKEYAGRVVDQYKVNREQKLKNHQDDGEWEEIFASVEVSKESYGEKVERMRAEFLGQKVGEEGMIQTVLKNIEKIIIEVQEHIRELDGKRRHFSDGPEFKIKSIDEYLTKDELRQLYQELLVEQEKTERFQATAKEKIWSDYYDKVRKLVEATVTDEEKRSQVMENIFSTEPQFRKLSINKDSYSKTQDRYVVLNNAILEDLDKKSAEEIVRMTFKAIVLEQMGLEKSSFEPMYQFLKFNQEFNKPAGKDRNRAISTNMGSEVHYRLPDQGEISKKLDSYGNVYDDDLKKTGTENIDFLNQIEAQQKFLWQGLSMRERKKLVSYDGFVHNMFLKSDFKEGYQAFSPATSMRGYRQGFQENFDVRRSATDDVIYSNPNSKSINIFDYQTAKKAREAYLQELSDIANRGQSAKDIVTERDNARDATQKVLQAEQRALAAEVEAQQTKEGAMDERIKEENERLASELEQLKSKVALNDKERKAINNRIVDLNTQLQMAQTELRLKQQIIERGQSVEGGIVAETQANAVALENKLTSISVALEEALKNPGITGGNLKKIAKKIADGEL